MEHGVTSTDAWTLITGKEYKTENGMMKSTTGNIYGIYDLAGGKREFIGIYYKDTTNVKISSILLDTAIRKSDEYLTTYKGNNIKNDYIIGDAIYETIRMNPDGSKSGFFTSEEPFLARGSGGTGDGNLLYFVRTNGEFPDSFEGYRVCLCVM